VLTNIDSEGVRETPTASYSLYKKDFVKSSTRLLAIYPKIHRLKPDEFLNGVDCLKQAVPGQGRDLKNLLGRGREKTTLEHSHFAYNEFF